MITRYGEIADRYPVWSLEDGLAEQDWDGWARLTAALGDRLQIVGDDILVTNPGIIAQAIQRNIANAALIKLNQIGTVTETLEAMRLCREAGGAQMVSHRSGETPDTFFADLTRRHRMRTDHERRSRAPRASREVQPADPDRIRVRSTAVRPNVKLPAVADTRVMTAWQCG
jgi:enolase